MHAEFVHGQRFTNIRSNDGDVMFRKMRRFKQALEYAECEKILQSCKSGVLAVSGDGGYPYTVPMSYYYSNGKLYFHSAKDGHKIDAIKENPKVSFCVVAVDEVLPEKFSGDFRSVVAFGTAKIIEDDAEKRSVMEMITRRYAPNAEQAVMDAKIDVRFRAVSIIVVDVEHLSGKESMDLVKMR